jgi:hypothetical protein
MYPRYTTWQWNQYNGWALFFGSSSLGSADQVKRALANYQPQNYYGVYGSYAMAADFEIYGYGGTTRYSWGYAPSGDNVWIIQYALTKIMRPDIIIAARRLTSSAQAGGGAPSWVQSEIAARAQNAHQVYGTILV